jgi:PAS domain S-box-containing protein
VSSWPKDDPTFLSTILEVVDDAVMVIDRHAVILYTNRAWRGYSPSDVVGLHIERIMAPEFHEGHRERMDRMLETGQSETFDLVLKRPDGVRRWYQGRSTPVFRPKREPVVISVSRDVTEMREAQEAEQVLRTLVPVCAWCRKIQSNEGAWATLEAYLEARAQSTVTHGICPECSTKALAES